MSTCPSAFTELQATLALWKRRSQSPHGLPLQVLLLVPRMRRAAKKREDAQNEHGSPWNGQTSRTKPCSGGVLAGVQTVRDGLDRSEAVVGKRTTLSLQEQSTRPPAKENASSKVSTRRRGNYKHVCSAKEEVPPGTAISNTSKPLAEKTHTHTTTTKLRNNSYTVDPASARSC